MALVSFIAMPAIAQAEETPTWSLDGQVGISSDYRFRGISLSNKDPQAFGELGVTHSSGFYGKVWGSNVAFDGGADDIETDLSIGWKKEVGSVSFDVGATYYVYPGNSGFNYYELTSSLGVKVGKAELSAGVAYSPRQANLDGQENTYFYVGADFPVGKTPLSAHGTFGIENGAFGDAKRDWRIGLSYDLGSGLTGTVDYVDTARAFTPLGNANVVASLTWGF